MAVSFRPGKRRPAPLDPIARVRPGIDPALGFERRWVIYQGEPEGSKVPPEWHAWLHHTVDEVPGAWPHYPWQKPHQPNMTGTPLAYHPRGSVLLGGHRARATGDYEPWSPE